MPAAFSLPTLSPADIGPAIRSFTSRAAALLPVKLPYSFPKEKHASLYHAGSAKLPRVSSSPEKAPRSGLSLLCRRVVPRIGYHSCATTTRPAGGPGDVSQRLDDQSPAPRQPAPLHRHNQFSAPEVVSSPLFVLLTFLPTADGRASSSPRASRSKLQRLHNEPAALLLQPIAQHPMPHRGPQYHRGRQ